jgi:hypothetical protein
VKKYKILPLIALVLLSGMQLSCEKILEVDLPANQIGREQVFKDVQTANAALASLYAGLRENSPVSASSGAVLSTYADDIDCFSLTDINNVFPIYNNQQINTNGTIYTFWQNAYQRIYEANGIIEGVEQAQFSAVEKNRIKGEAMLIRSIVLFYLQQLFGDIPYVETTDYVINRSISKISSVEALNRLNVDLNECASLLSDEYRSSERIFPNRKVAQLMLAKVYLLQHKWNEAELLLKTVVQSPLYQFQQDLDKVYNKTSTHILWQLKPQNVNDPTRESIFYYFANSAPQLYAISDALKNAFSSGDLRMAGWMAPVVVNGKTWYRADKYKNRITNTTEYSIIFRVEEAYLLLAESLTQQNRPADALPYLNPTRERGGLDPITMPIEKEVLLDEVILESRKEFFAEMGHRFLDLKRMNRLNVLANAKPNWMAFHALWPIPQKELLLNTNLNPQNKDY